MLLAPGDPLVPTVLPGAIPMQAFDPTVVADAPAPFRAAASFLLVVLFGGAVLTRFGAFVDRSIASSMERPLLSMVYGLVVHGLLVLGGVYAVSQLLQVGVAGGRIWTGIALIIGVVWLVLAGVGVAVVGTYATEAAGDRRPWVGLVGGSAALATAWIVLPFLYGLLAWVFVVSAGIGGPTKEWLHASRGPGAGAEA